MRGVKRGRRAPPSSLGAKSGNPLRTELEAARAGLATAPAPGEKRPAFKFKAYRSDEVKRRLEELFHGKCAYCESFFASQAPVDVEHYRPKGAVEGVPDHPGYWWLGMDWSNLLPSCLDCNRRRRQRLPEAIGDLGVLYRASQSGKKDAFPIEGVRADAEDDDLAAERPMLLDPTRDDPHAHLTYWLGPDAAGGLVLPRRTDGVVEAAAQLPAVGTPAEAAAHATDAGLSVRGAVSIQVYGLNRVRLVQDRARLLQTLRFLESLAVELGDIWQRLEADGMAEQGAVTDAIRRLKLLQGGVLAEMRRLAAPEMPHSTLAAAYLSDFSRRVRLPPPAPEQT